MGSEMCIRDSVELLLNTTLLELNTHRWVSEEAPSMVVDYSTASGGHLSSTAEVKRQELTPYCSSGARVLTAMNKVS